MHNLLLANDSSVTDGRICPPPTAEIPTLGLLLDNVAHKLTSGGVLALSGKWADLLTTDPGTWESKVQEGDTWIRWTRGRHSIWTAQIDAMAPRTKSTPLIHEDAIVTGIRLNLWYQATGVPWIGTPGMAGNALLRALMERTATGETQRKMMALGKTWELGDIEAPYHRRDWQQTAVKNDHVHGYDLNKAYLAAIGNVLLARSDLKRRGGYHEFDASRAGLWRVALSPWAFLAELPDPAGYAPLLPDGTRWVTTPTLELLDQLTEAGRYGGFTVHESYTAPGFRLTRDFADLLRQGIQADTDLSYAAACVYKQTYGMWRRVGSMLYRPDWHYAVIALNRANLWRKLDQAQTKALMRPLWIETDCVYYGSAERNWAQAAPATFRLDPTGMQLGAFKQEQVRTPRKRPAKATAK